MSKIIAVLTVFSALAMPLQGIAGTIPTANTNAPHEVTVAAVPPASDPHLPVTPGDHVVTLAPVAVSVPRPHIWTYQKGNSKVLVLGTVYPEPVGLTFIPGSINHAIGQSGAVIGSPWFDWGAHINIFHIISVWHAASGVKYLPDGKTLADVLSPSDLQQWNTLKAQYLPNGDKVERMRPMYAGWKLYDSVLKHSGVAVDSSIGDLIKSAAVKHNVPQINAQFHWLIKDPEAAAHAFEPSQEADLACFHSILTGIRAVPDSSRTLAAAWAVGDVATMKTYVGSHVHTGPCWGSVTDTAVAEQQGLNRKEEERKAWLAAFNAAAAKYPVVFTTAPIQDIFKPAYQIEWLMQEGYVEVDTDADPSAAPTPVTAVSQVSSTADGLAEHRQ